MAKVNYEVENQIATITIDSPPVNALETQVLDELSEIVDKISEDVNVVIITGAGNKAFVAGADIKDFPKLTKETGVELVKKGQQIFQKISDLEQPVIAAVDGFALGGGLELALACDFRVATNRSQFGLPEVKLGVLPGYGGTQRLPRLIGSGKAKQLIFSGEFLSAEDAYKVGIVEEVVEGSALDEAKKWAEKISQRGPLAVRAAKKAVNEGLEQPLEEGLNIEATYFGTIAESEDKNEGVAAFFEKREPKFTRK